MTSDAAVHAEQPLGDGPVELNQHLEHAAGSPLRTTALRAPTAAATRVVAGALLAADEYPSGGLVSASRSQRSAKRTIDIVVSLTALLVTAPLLGVVALLIKLTSPGPLLYVDWRVGHGGRQFQMYKFRSMYRDAARHRGRLRHDNEVTGPVFKMRADPRITPIGRIMRKLSIDELPQFANVLLGDMSLVGPRPPLPTEFRTYTQRQRQRLSVRPGLTCTWQVSGRSDIPFDQWIDMDLEYIRTWTLLRDLVLLVRTVPAVLSGRGAY